MQYVGTILSLSLSNGEEKKILLLTPKPSSMILN